MVIPRAVFTVLNLLQFTGTDQTGQTIFLLVSVAVALVAGGSRRARVGARLRPGRGPALG